VIRPTLAGLRVGYHSPVSDRPMDLIEEVLGMFQACQRIFLSPPEPFPDRYRTACWLKFDDVTTSRGGTDFWLEFFFPFTIKECMSR
jgi:hypothetical protein